MGDSRVLFPSFCLVVITNLALMIILTLNPDVTDHPRTVFIGLNAAMSMPVWASLAPLWERLRKMRLLGKKRLQREKL